VLSGEIQLKFETVLPQLADFEGKSDRLRRQWLQFQAVIIDHEAGHHKIYRQLVRQLPQALESVGRVPCSELDDTIKVAVSRVVDTMRQASAEYDEETGPGKYMVSSL
jgi:predicted secreted Zn-dependent protease